MLAAVKLIITIVQNDHDKIKSSRMTKWLGLILLVICYGLAGCRLPSDIAKTEQKEVKSMRYLALGDSYTIGESVKEAERWPIQLATQLNTAKIVTEPPQIIAHTGWTTDDLLYAIANEKPQGPFDLVSLLIGVNNQFQQRSSDEYRTQFRTLLQKSIELAGGKADHVIVVSIPDWGVTPFAQKRDHQEIAAEINLFNAINQAEASAAGVPYVNITPISRQATSDSSLIAEDGLHPSGKMYQQWVTLLLPRVKTILGEDVKR
jgi:lysophospholipase L1-like esterase